MNAAFALAFILFTLMFAGWFFVDGAGKQESLKQRSTILHLVQQGVLSVNVRQIQGLTASQADLGTAGYRHVKAYLQALRKVTPGIRFLYLMRRVNGQAVFLADSEPPGSRDESPPGQVLQEAPRELMEVFDSGRAVVEGPSADRWGTWLSAYAPLNDPRTGVAVAILGLDQNAREYVHNIARERAIAIIFIGLLCVVALLSFVYYQQFVEALESRGQVREDPFLRWGTLGLVVLLGFALTMMFFLREQGREWEMFRAAFLQRAASRVEMISQTFAIQMDRLEGIQRFYEKLISMERVGFSRHVRPVMEDTPFQALEWVPRVRREERAGVEARARQDGLAGFVIREKDSGGRLIPAGERDEYFPVYFLEPLKGNEPALGFDLASDPVRRAAIEKSRDEGQVLATAPVRLVQASGDTSGFLVFVPVYGPEGIPPTVDERRRALRGFILGVYRGEAFLKGAYLRIPAEGLSCLVEDPQAPPGSRVLYWHKVRRGSVNWDKPLLKYSIPLLMAEREWRVTIVPGSAFVEAYLSWGYFWIIPIGIVVTGMIALFLNVLMMGRCHLEWLVRSRTAELSAEKDSLQRSQEEVRLILNSAAEAIYGIDKDGKCIFCNSSCARILGYKDEEDLIGKQMHDLIHHTGADGKPVRAEDCPLLKAYSEGEIVHVEDKFWKADGSGFFVEVWAHPQSHEGKRVGSVVTFVDITERKQVNDALRVSKIRFDEMAELSREVIFEVDAQGLYTYVSHVCGEVYGYTREELVRKKYFYDLFPEEAKEALTKEALAVFKKKGIFKDFFNPIVHRDGHAVLLSMSAIPILGKDGDLVGYRGIDRDITASKAAEEALRAGEERYRQIASAITDYIYTVDIENGNPVRTNYNSVCLAVTGYSVDEFRADPMLWIKIVVEEDRPLVLRQVEEIMSGKKEVDPIEHRVIHKNGYALWVKNTIVLHHDADGRLVSYDGLIADVSARKEAEKVLEDQKKALDEHAIVSKTDVNGCVTYVNDRFCQVSQYSREELLGQNHRIVNSSYHPKAFFANMWRTISGGRVWQGKIRNRAKDGSFYWVQSTIVPFMDERGHVKEYISARTDITQNVENEERLEQAMQVKSNFVSTVSHELRTPLASIKSSVDILNTEAPGKLTEDQKVFLGRVKSNIDRLARLINDVLDLSKLESGKMTMNLVPLRSQDVIRDVVGIQGSVAKSKGIDLEAEFNGDLPVFFVDKDRLIQVFNNLINNALKFTKKGKVVVTASCDDQKKMIFCVRDTGDGIKEADLPKLFQKFQQVGGVSHQVSGTGLGLAICKEIVERHGGRIWVESRQGQGSSFFFSIPVKYQRRILIVDDDRGSLEVMRGILKEMDKYVIESASDGFEAGQKCLEFNPQLIIMDIGLPKVNGLEVCSRIKHDARTRDIKVIMISVFTEDLEKKAWEAGADEIVRKPLDPEELLLKVNNLC